MLKELHLVAYNDDYDIGTKNIMNLSKITFFSFTYKMMGNYFKGLRLLLLKNKIIPLK
jgi:hypothetical protein